jgi:outer membrane lipoprotein SlyB
MFKILLILLLGTSYLYSHNYKNRFHVNGNFTYFLLGSYFIPSTGYYLSNGDRRITKINIGVIVRKKILYVKEKNTGGGAVFGASSLGLIGNHFSKGDPTVTVVSAIFGGLLGNSIEEENRNMEYKCEYKVKTRKGYDILHTNECHLDEGDHIKY